MALVDDPSLDPSLGFHWVDYLVFALSLGITIAIGIYFACTGGKQRTLNEFLFADKKANVVAVGVSALSSNISAVAIVGLPAEIYFSGIMYALYQPLGLLPMTLIVSHIFIPVYHRLQLVSAYEYLERRFNFGVRILGTVMFIISQIIFLAIVLYAPSLALNVVMGVPFWVCVLITTLICTFYSAFGGIKAVIWTDTFQMLVLLIGVLTLTIKGAVDVGGFDYVFQEASNGSRLQWNEFSPDPRVRHTFWSQAIGQGCFQYLAGTAANQMFIQRFLCVDRLKDAQRSMYVIGVVGMLATVLIPFLGLVMYAYMGHCDPLRAGYVTRPDHVVPYFLLKIFGGYHGLPGLFTAAVFSAALSSMSSIINSMSLLFLEELLKPAYKSFTKRALPERAAIICVKVAVVTFGLLTIGLTYLAPLLGSRILQITQSIFGGLGGPLVGLFAVGMLFPWINSVGAAVGTITSFACILWISIGSITYIQIQRLPVYVDECLVPPNSTAPPPPPPSSPGPILTNIYSISYAWYGFLAILLVIIVANIVSLITCNRRGQDPVDPDLLWHPGSCCKKTEGDFNVRGVQYINKSFTD